MRHSKGLVFWALTSLMLAALALPGSLKAQGNFVYTNDDIPFFFGPNTVSGFSVASNGTLAAVPGSPFATGGNGIGTGFFASNRVKAATVGSFLFASNTGSNNVSVLLGAGDGTFLTALNSNAGARPSSLVARERSCRVEYRTRRLCQGCGRRR